MSVEEIQDMLFVTYKKNGHFDMWNLPDTSLGKGMQKILERNGYTISIRKIFDLAEVGLIGTEVAELQEEIRNKNTNKNKIGEECADIIIRVLNYMSRNGIVAEKSILKKDGYNLRREKLHGRGV